MAQNDDEKKLDWMYKGANSLVDREEYLLGKSVDKSLEQLNAEERDKKLGILPPKNHVEHECIPPSIRDFNKIVQSEQVDLSAKLQEDPLMAIKKREEEARRQFLQNPVQLKKLQEALKAQQLKKSKKKKKSKRSKASDSESDSDLDRKIAKKLKYLKNDSIAVSTSKKVEKKKSKDDILDTILMHKFNQLKEKLSQDDLNDILAGKVSSSDDEKEKKLKNHKRRNTSSSDSNDDENEKLKINKSRKDSFSRERNEKNVGNMKKIHRNRSSSSSSSDDGKFTKSKLKEEDYREKNKKSRSFNYDEAYKRKQRADDQSKRRRNSSSDDNDKTEIGKWKERKIHSIDDKIKHKISSESTVKSSYKNKDTDDDLENKILQRLRQLRDSAKSNPNDSSRRDTSSENEEERKDSNKTQQGRYKSRDSSSSDNDHEKIQAQYDSDNDEYVEKPKAFGLVKSDGTKLALQRRSYEVKSIGQTSKKVVTPIKTDRKNVKKLTEEEKEKLRKEMMKNAEKRDKERSENLRKYREENENEQKNSKGFDKDFMHRELLKSSKDATVETRIKSNLNNIQRSSRHMDSHFSRRK